MNQDLTSVDARPADRAARRAELKRLRWRRLSRTALIAAGVLALLWFVAGGIYYVLQVRSHALAAEAQLQRAKQSLLNGSGDQATADITAARADVNAAHAYVGKPQLATVGHIPYLGRAVADMHHLVKAADAVTTVSQRVSQLYGEVGGGKLIDGNHIDLAALQRAAAGIPSAQSAIKKAESELEAVHGYFWEPGVDGSRKRVLRQVEDLDSSLRGMAPVLAIMPDVLGANGPRRYVITIMNPAELRFSGGAPLSLALATFDHGSFVIDHRGQTFDLTNGNAKIRWQPVSRDPWQTGVSRLVNSTFSPDWPTSGEEFLRAYAAQFGIEADGVIALDPVALQDLLKATGPFQAPGYGEITAANLLSKIIGDAYAEHRNMGTRHALNDELMDVMISRLTHGGHLVTKVAALGTALDGNHLRIYSRRGDVQSLLATHHRSGALPRPGTDVMGVYTQNTNASKVDYFQHRSITQRVVINSDGSARVVRTVALRNEAPAFVGSGKDPGSGYFTAVSKPFLAVYVPGGATSITMRVQGQPVTPAVRSDHGQLAVTRQLLIERGERMTIVISYHIPKALTAKKGRWTYHLDLLNQPIVNAADFTLELVLPKTYSARSTPGFTRSDGALKYSALLDGNRDLAVSMGRS